MARNEEKAMTMLNRWVKQKQDIFSKNNGQSQSFSAIPNDPSCISDLLECENFRKRVVGNIIRRVSQIQNAALPEAKIMELNDQINSFLSQKIKWETQIFKLGGPDYNL
jgi:hypothetical protein